MEFHFHLWNVYKQATIEPDLIFKWEDNSSTV